MIEETSMIFINSSAFWLVFPFIFMVTWLLPRNLHMGGISLRNGFLLLCSYVLYALFSPAALISLVSITLISYLAGLVFEKKQSRGALMVAIVVLLLQLIFAKYCFLPGLSFIVPLGISFFTFSSISYVVDVYQKKVNAEHNLVDYALYVGFFPCLVSGPINRAGDILPQLKNWRPFSSERMEYGLYTAMWGIFMKVVVADRFGLYVDHVYAGFNELSGATCFVAAVMYSVQIYADFAGYSLMAIGIAHALGLDIHENFRRPYFSTSVGDFWRRWHISLSSWLRDYVYIPLGGSRCSKLRSCFNTIITFLVSGIWHGANWTFVLWGGLYGVILSLEKLAGVGKRVTGNVVTPFRIAFVFGIVTCLWVVFRMPDVRSAADFFHRIIFDWSNGELYYESVSSVFFYFVGIVILFSKDMFDEWAGVKYGKLIERRSFQLVTTSLLLALTVSIGVLDSGQFIYANF